jgi:hypothetical protein
MYLGVFVKFTSWARGDKLDPRSLKVAFEYLDLDFKSIDLKCLDSKSVDFKISYFVPFIKMRI